jgi:hypothetical protein
MADISNDEDYQNYLITGNSKTNIVNVHPYTLVKDAYHGSGGFRDGSYIVKHPRENNYVERINYSANLNYFKPILDALVNPVFQNPPERHNENGNESWQLFEENCDLKGGDLNSFMRRAALRAKRDGAIFIIMDNFKEVPLSQGEALENRVLPYIYWKKAEECVYYRIDKFGKLIEIAFSEPAGESTKDSASEDYYRKWTAEGWELYKDYDDEKEEFKNLVDSGLNPIGKIPIVKILTGEPEEDPILPTPPLYDVARLNVMVYNLWSEAREIMRRAGFPFLGIPMGQGMIPNDIKLGAGNMLGFPADSSEGPKYISPDTDIIQIYIDTANNLVEEMYKQAKINGVTGVVEQTGRAKEWDFQSTKTELLDFSRELERAERDIVDMFALWTGEDVQVTVSYNEDFGVTDLQNDIEQGERIIDMGVPVEVENEIKKDLVSAYFSKYDMEERNELLTAMDNFQVDQQESISNDAGEEGEGNE